MAKCFAFAAADIVGSTDLVSVPTVGAAGITTQNYVVVNTGDYHSFYTSTPPITLASNMTAWSHLKYTGAFSAGIGEVDQAWRADSGDTYLLSEIIALLVTPGTVPGKTAFTQQDVNQFFFKAEDRIHGSEEDDKLCGWEEDDSLWGDEGDDEFYYGEGMGRDKILDFDKNDDEIILDEDLVENFKQLRGDVKLKTDKIVLSFDSSDKLTIFGIDTLKELKSVVAFDDFTDFS